MFALIWSFVVAIFYYLAGIISAFIIYVYLFSTKSTLEHESHHKSEVCEPKLPQHLLEVLQSGEIFKHAEDCSALNYILQFIFQEKQYDKELHQWLTDLLSQEFADLLKHKALSKFLKKMEIKELILGNNLPSIESAKLEECELVKDSQRIRKVIVSLYVKYKGGFQLAIDATTKLSQKAVVKIKAIKLEGRACFELTRDPFTHWKFSFYEEPEFLLKVDASVLGRSIPQVESIIENQLYAVVKKKHTLPNYKMRGPPLVRRKTGLADDILKPEAISFPATLFATIVNCTRLQPSLVGASMYFSLTLSEVPLVCAYETPVGIWLTQDILIKKDSSASLGILLRTADDNSQIIETVNSKSAAQEAGLRKNDIILAVNNIPLLSSVQAGKLFSTSSSSKNNSILKMKLRIKRLIFTDHKKSSIEIKNPFETFGSLPDGPLCSRAFTPTDEEMHIDNIPKSPVSIQGDKVVFSLQQRFNSEPEEQSNVSTPESSRSSSPDLKLKSLNLSSLTSDLSPIQSCDEDVASSNLDVGWEKIPKMALSSSPIQIPSSSNKLSTETCNEKSSNSAHSSRAGTPTFEFVSHMVPPGMPLLKMDVKSSTKKLNNKNRLILKHFETAPINGCCNPTLGNDFEFDVEDESNYLNMCVWSHNLPGECSEKIPSTASEKGVAATKDVIHKLMKKDSKDSPIHSERKFSKDLSKNSPRSMTGHPENFLIGFTNIRVKDLLKETALNSQRNVIKVVSLEPADPSCPEVADHPMYNLIGFEPDLCYGDTTLSITLQAHNISKVQRNLEKGFSACEDDSATDVTQSEDEDNGDNSDLKEDRDHTFKRTHFNSSTQCNFCQKKIWLKDAYQCSECGVICHKKCMMRCEQETICDTGGLRFRESKKFDKEIPDILTPSSSSLDSKATKKSPPHSPQSSRHTLGSFLTQIGSDSLKRTGSAHNLALPLLSSDFGFSRSLPPSPSHRKASLLGNPFVSEEDSDSDKHMELVYDRLIANPYDDRLMSLAKESADQLHSELSPSLRLERIKKELETLHERVNRENQIRVDLSSQEKTDSTKKAKMSQLLVACDARTQALALLTMHYFTALQIAQEASTTGNQENL